MVSSEDVRAALAACEDRLPSAEGLRAADLLAELAGVEFDPLLNSAQAAAYSGLLVEGWRSAIKQGNAPAADVEWSTGCRTRRRWRRSTVVAWREARRAR